MTESLIGSDGPPAPLVPVGLPIDLSNLVDGQILAYNATTGYWYNRTTLPATAGVDSIGPSGSPLTGAVVVASPNTTLNLSVSGQNLQLDINLANANTWTALQTFGAGITGTGNMGTLTAGTGVLGTANTWTALQTFNNNISIGGATFAVATLTTNQVLQYNGTNWVNATLPTSGVTSISNTDGTLTISPTTGAVVASLALAHANTWTAAQTFTTPIQTSQNGISTNLGIGTGALAVNTGSTDTAVGYNTLHVNTTGDNNTAFGSDVLESNTTGDNNTGVGTFVFAKATTAGNNTAIGYGVLLFNTTGAYNTGVGSFTFYNYNNTASVSGYLVGIGYSAGYNYTGAEQNNIVIGYNLGVAGESNMLRIGNAASGAAGQGQIAFSQIGLVGLGLPPIYGSAQGVSIAATSTVIATYTPTATGTFRVVVTIECKVAATLDTLTVTYTGSATALAMTQTLATSVALTAGTAVSYVAEAYATTATAVSVQATASVAADLFGTATIERLA